MKTYSFFNLKNLYIGKPSSIYFKQSEISFNNGCDVLAHGDLLSVNPDLIYQIAFTPDLVNTVSMKVKQSLNFGDLPTKNFYSKQLDILKKLLDNEDWFVFYSDHEHQTKLNTKFNDHHSSIIAQSINPPLFLNYYAHYLKAHIADLEKNGFLVD